MVMYGYILYGTIVWSGSAFISPPGSGSMWIRIHLTTWILIRYAFNIRIQHGKIKLYLKTIFSLCLGAYRYLRYKKNNSCELKTDWLFCFYTEPVPDNSANAVKVAVAKNFEELVAKSEKVTLFLKSFLYQKFQARPTFIYVWWYCCRDCLLLLKDLFLFWLKSGYIAGCVVYFLKRVPGFCRIRWWDVFDT